MAEAVDPQGCRARRFACLTWFMHGLMPLVRACSIAWCKTPRSAFSIFFEFICSVHLAEANLKCEQGCAQNYARRKRSTLLALAEGAQSTA